MNDLFPGRTEPLEHRHTRKGSGAVHDRPWSADDADIKVKAACKSCNSGWMDKLDHEAEDWSWS